MIKSIESRLTDLAMCDDSEHKAKMVVDIVKMIESVRKESYELGWDDGWIANDDARLKALDPSRNRDYEQTKKVHNWK